MAVSSVCSYQPIVYQLYSVNTTILDISLQLNYVLKRILKHEAGNWLAALMYANLKETHNDPTKLRLAIGLTYIRKYVNFWLKNTLTEMNKDVQTPNNLRGWRESGMLDALAADKDKDRADFLVAKELKAKGELFMYFTSNKNAEKAERILRKHTLNSTVLLLITKRDQAGLTIWC